MKKKKKSKKKAVRRDELNGCHVDLEGGEFDFLRPDKTRLDEEWVNQPKLFFDYACRLAEARLKLGEIEAELAVMKTELDNTKAEVDLNIRANPERFDIPADVRITENLVKQTVIQQPKCRTALRKVREIEDLRVQAWHKVNVLQAAVTALDHRKAALERLVSLHGQSYFATPRAPDEDSREVVGEIEKRSARSKVRKVRGRL